MRTSHRDVDVGFERSVKSALRLMKQDDIGRTVYGIRIGLSRYVNIVQKGTEDTSDTTGV